MKIVAIDASPGRGVISLSVEEAAASAETAGATVERVRLAALRVHSCTGCGWCKLTGVCKIPDDLPALAESIDDADGVGEVGNPVCGDVMKITIKVDDTDHITDLKFQTLGCGAAIATSSIVTELAKGM